MTIGKEDIPDAKHLVVSRKVRADLVPEGLLALTLEDDNVVIRSVIPLEEPAGAGVGGNRSPSLGKNGGCGIVGHHHAGLVLMQPSPEEQFLRIFTDLPSPLRATFCPCAALVAQSLIVIIVFAERLIPAVERLESNIAELLVDLWDEHSGSVRKLKSGRRLRLCQLRLGTIPAPFHDQTEAGQTDVIRPVGDNDIAGGEECGSGAFSDGLGDLDARGFGHGGDQPFAAAAATGTLPGLPVLALGTIKHIPLVLVPEQGS